MIEDFLQMVQNNEQDPLSLLIFIAQQSVETITDVESASKLTFNLVCSINQNDFYGQILRMLHNLKEHEHLLMSISNEQIFKIHVRDKFLFTTLLIVSLKYKRELFIQSSQCHFLQVILQEALALIHVLRYQSLYILRFIELILKKREDVLTTELSLLILKSMNKASYSPLTGFKNWAHNVSRIVLRSLPHSTKKHLCNFNNLPIKGIDLNDILKQCEEKEVRKNFDLISKQILKLFCNNTESREASFYYEAVTNICMFDEFVEKIWPCYRDYFKEFDEGEFYQSFLKYWIPITVKHYGNDFYEFISNKDVNFQLKASTLLEIRKKGFYNTGFDSDTWNFLKYPRTSNTGLRILCTFLKKNVYPNEFEIQCVRFYLNHYSHFEFLDDALKCLKQFISQIFLVCHLTLSRSLNKNLTIYSDFLNFLYRFCFFRINDREDCEVSAQILKLVWDVASGSSSDLITGYKVDRENTYETGTNSYFEKLIETNFWQNTFLNRLLIKQMENVLIVKFKHCPKLIQVIKERYLKHIDIENFVNLPKLLENISSSVCLQSSEKIRAYTDLFLSYKKLKMEDCSNDVTTLLKIFEFQNFFDSQNMFTCVLILDVLIIVLCYDDLDLTPLLEKSLSSIQKVFNDDLTQLNTKEIKVLESFINNVIECVTVSKNHWSKFNKDQLLNYLCTIIQLSNMKRPVSLSANFVNYFGTSLEHDDRIVKIKLLDRTLSSLYHNKQSGKMRRNPETRLVIHALSLSDKNLTKPLLASSLLFMLEVLANPLSSDSTLSSTLHSLEVLISDNSIHQFTLPYITDIIKHCIRLFSKNSWIVRNADLQLLKSLIERFLGVSLDENVRPKTIEDLFILFPSLISHFYESLSTPELNDRAIIVLLFFSESQIKNDLLLGEYLKNYFEKFKYLFVEIIKNYTNNVGFLAIKAFTSLCTNAQIPNVFAEIVYYIQRDFVQMKMNFFANLIKLLQELYHKYKSALVRTGEDVIRREVKALVNYLKRFNYFCFNLLSLRLSTFNDIVDKVVATLSYEIDYKERIWLNNYLPFVIMKVDLIHLGDLLNKILSFQIPEFLQVKILSILVDRANDITFPVTKIIKILMLKLATMSDYHEFLIMAYSKSILLFYEFTHDLKLSEDVITQIRRDFHTNSIYKVFIYVLSLAHCEYKNKDDDVFLIRCVQMYIDTINDNEALVDLSATMIHLYKSVPTKDRYNVMKLIFYLLLNDSTSFEMCKFMSWLTKTQCSSILISLTSLLNCSNLTKYVGDKELGVKLLLEFYRYVRDLPDELEESDTYYLIENYCPLTKQYVLTIILKSLDVCIDKPV